LANKSPTEITGMLAENLNRVLCCPGDQMSWWPNVLQSKQLLPKWCEYAFARFAAAPCKTQSEEAALHESEECRQLETISSSMTNVRAKAQKAVETPVHIRSATSHPTPKFHKRSSSLDYCSMKVRIQQRIPPSSIVHYWRTEIQ